MSTAKNRIKLGVPRLVCCPSCKRAMHIESVTPRLLRGNSAKVNYSCVECGTSNTENSDRLDSVSGGANPA